MEVNILEVMVIHTEPDEIKNLYLNQLHYNMIAMHRQRCLSFDIFF